MRRTRSNQGFTLIELVITVGMLGLLAALAIPNFMTYQARARRSEAYANLRAIASAENAYFTENGIYFEAPPHPNPGGTGESLGADTHGWDAAAENDFKALGWKPEGRVRYAYDINTGATGCTCANTCFTATGYGDVDNDDLLSAVMYVHPVRDAGGSWIECPSHLFGFGTPLGRGGGGRVYDEVAVNWQSDEY